MGIEIYVDPNIIIRFVGYCRIYNSFMPYMLYMTKCAYVIGQQNRLKYCCFEDIS